MSDNNIKIKGMLGTKYSPTDSREPCFEFCQHIRSILQMELVKNKTALEQIEHPNIGDYVLFKLGDIWHGGILWPDCLHFIHINLNVDKTWDIQKSRLTKNPWKLSFDGYYTL